MYSFSAQAQRRERSRGSFDTTHGLYFVKSCSEPMQSPVQLRLNVRLLGSLLVHGFSPLEQRSIPFGFVPTDLPLIVPPSHSLQPRLQPTDIHRHVCLLVVQKRQRRVSERWTTLVRSVARTHPISQAELPFLHAHACPQMGPKSFCHRSGESSPCFQRGSLPSIAFRGLGEMRLECAAAEATSADRVQILMASVEARKDGVRGGGHASLSTDTAVYSTD